MHIKLSFGSVLIKYLLFTFNLIFVITGIGLLGFGFIIQTVYQRYEHFLNPQYFDMASLFVCVGCVVFVVAFLGCCGAIKESSWMVLTFSLLLASLLFIELAGSAGSLVLSGNAYHVIETKFNETMHLYNHSTEITRVWDALQANLMCCGGRNAEDWYPILNGSLPMSCCEDQVGAIAMQVCDVNSTTLHHAPCLKVLGNIIRENSGSIAVVALGFAGVQMLGILFACTLSKSIRNQYHKF